MFKSNIFGPVYLRLHFACVPNLTIQGVILQTKINPQNVKNCVNSILFMKDDINDKNAENYKERQERKKENPKIEDDFQPEHARGWFRRLPLRSQPASLPSWF